MPENGRPGREDGWVDATGARRRLQALAVQGFSTTVLWAESGIARLTVSDIRSGTQQRIRASTLRVIIALHNKLWDVDPLDMSNIYIIHGIIFNHFLGYARLPRHTLITFRRT